MENKYSIAFVILIILFLFSGCENQKYEIKDVINDMSEIQNNDNSKGIEIEDSKINFEKNNDKNILKNAKEKELKKCSNNQDCSDYEICSVNSECELLNCKYPYVLKNHNCVINETNIDEKKLKDCKINDNCNYDEFCDNTKKCKKLYCIGKENYIIKSHECHVLPINNSNKNICQNDYDCKYNENCKSGFCQRFYCGNNLKYENHKCKPFINQKNQTGVINNNSNNNINNVNIENTKVVCDLKYEDNINNKCIPKRTFDGYCKYDDNCAFYQTCENGFCKIFECEEGKVQINHSCQGVENLKIVCGDNKCDYSQKCVNNKCVDLKCEEWEEIIDGKCVQSKNYCGKVECSKYQKCVDDKCVLDNNEVDIGVVYIYSDEKTYNNNWKKELTLANSNVKKSGEEVLNDKIKFNFEILGDFKLEDYCWNPAELFFFESSSESINPKTGESYFKRIYFQNPGSYLFEDLKYQKVLSTQSIKGTWNYSCKNCVESFNDNTFILKASCKDSYKKLLSNKINKYEIKEKIKNKYSKIDEYDIILFVYGKIGQAYKDENYKNEIRFGDFGSIVGANNFNGDIHIGEYTYTAKPEILYNENYPLIKVVNSGEKIGLHEILHNFGAVDVYKGFLDLSEDGKNNYNKCLEMDKNCHKSIMGNTRCGNVVGDDDECKIEDISLIYLDKYNQEILGLD